MGDSDCYIVGSGICLPPRRVRNVDLPSSLGIAVGSIEKKTGIHERRWADRGTYASTLGAEACRRALSSSSMDGADVDCLIAATQSPDHNIPGIGVTIQDALDMDEIPCLDIRNQCSSFLYALQIASSFIEAGRYQNVLIVCAEVQSHALGSRPEDAHVTPLFGDGAGAVIVSAHGSFGNLKVERVQIGSRGQGNQNLRHRFWDFSQIPPDDLSRLPETREAIYFPEMNGEFVFRAAVKRMVAECRTCLSNEGISVADIGLFLAHQANASINSTVGSLLGIRPEIAFSNIERVGNLSSASLPVLLAEAVEANRIPDSGYVLCTAFGAGFTWGAALLSIMK
jgi:3-oxoacyl-[acyl-carrier-protein] synthase III